MHLSYRSEAWQVENTKFRESIPGFKVKTLELWGEIPQKMKFCGFDKPFSRAENKNFNFFRKQKQFYDKDLMLRISNAQTNDFVCLFILQNIFLNKNKCQLSKK